MLLFLPSLYGFSITINSPSANQALTGVNTIDIDLGFSSDINGNASAVYFYYKNQSEEEKILLVNTTGNFMKYTYNFNASNFEDTLTGSLIAVVTNISNDNVTASVAIKIDNKAPVYNIIPNITMPEDTINDTINLSIYFSDTEQRNTFSYSASSVDDIDISIDSTKGIVTINPDNNFSGVREVRFTASDGLLSNTSNYITINVTNVNDKPLLIKNIENRTWVKNTNITISLGEYFSDVDGDSLNYSYVIEKNHAGITIDSNGIATIKPEQDYLGLDSVVFTASDGSLSIASNKVILELIGKTDSKTPVISSASPVEKIIELGEGDTKTFTITKSDPENDKLSVKWYVNDGLKQQDTDSYTFSEITIGSYTLKVEVSDGINKITTSWTIIISAKQESNTNITVNGSTCGNGVVDDGEDCETCAADVACRDGEECIKKLCTAVKGGSNWPIITGLAVIVIIITTIVTLLYYRKKKNELFAPVKPRDLGLKSYYNGKDEMPSANVDDFYINKNNKGLEKKDVVNSKIGADYSRNANKGFSKTDNALLRNYVKMAVERNMSDINIKKKLSSKGWDMQQIEKVIKELR